MPKYIDSDVDEKRTGDVLSKRVPYDLSMFTFGVGNIGQLQTLATYLVVAGDSMEFNVDSIFALSPLRRNMYVDCGVDLFAFFIPHRHIYGDNWIAFLKDGTDEGVTLGTDTFTGELFCAGNHIETGAICPRWLSQGYMRIWNAYFKVPSEVDTSLTYLSGLASGNVYTHYGMRCAYPSRNWNSAVTAHSDVADKRFALVDTDKIDLGTMAETQGRFKTERKRDFFARRYYDIMSETWGTRVSKDTEFRPELLMHNFSYLSGYDVNGTDAATLGDYSGRGQSAGHMHIPNRFFSEHGTVWIMAVLRFPPIHRKEHNYLVNFPEPTYKQIAGDPDFLRRAEVQAMDERDWIEGATLNSGKMIPYGQWYREQPHYVHNLYGTVSGHPFIDQLFSTIDSVNYIEPSEYDDCFVSTQLRHWQWRGRISCVAKRVIPDPRISMFAGT